MLRHKTIKIDNHYEKFVISKHISPRREGFHFATEINQMMATPQK